MFNVQISPESRTLLLALELRNEFIVHVADSIELECSASFISPAGELIKLPWPGILSLSLFIMT